MSDIDEEVLEERIYTVPLGKLIYTRGIPRGKRTPRAVRLVKQFVMKHLKVDHVSMDKELSEALWARGIQKPPRHIRIRCVKTEEDAAEVYLA
jgi:large subunit ribosomal protein L31e